MHVYNFRRWRTLQPRPIHSTHPVRQHTTKLKLRRLCNKIHVYFFTYRNTPTGKTRKMFAPFAQPPETPDSFSTWLDNNEIKTCTNLRPGSPSINPTVNQHIPMLHASPVLTKYLLQVPLVLDTSYHSTKGAPSLFFQH